MGQKALKKSKTIREQHGGHFHDILEVARLLGASTVPEKVLETVLTHLCDRLGKRARCVFLEGDELRLRYWAGEHLCPLGDLKVDKDSIVWEAVKKGAAINVTDPRQTNGYRHTLSQPIKIKAIIPLGFSDPMTRQEKKLGALIVDSGKGEAPISSEDFEYLQVIGQLLSAVLGRAQLIDQLLAICSRQEAILMETAHNFRNRIAVIGGFSRHIAQLAHNTELAEKAMRIHEEVRALEANLVVFEKYMAPETKESQASSRQRIDARPS